MRVSQNSIHVREECDFVIVHMEIIEIISQNRKSKLIKKVNRIGKFHSSRYEKIVTVWRNIIGNHFLE